MNIIDLTENYLDSLDTSNLKVYEGSYPKLFEHYFYYWGDRQSFTFSLTASEVIKKKKLILDILPDIEERFRRNALSIENIKLVLFVGGGWANGHAFKDDDEFIVWIPIETYSSSLQIDVFITHEIVHALHYKQVPELYFKNKEAKYDVTRQLICEGVATYVTHQLTDYSEKVVIFADLLSNADYEKWKIDCENKIEEYKKIVSKNLLKESRSLFEANNRNDALQFKAGYYWAYKLILSLSEKDKLSINKMLQIDLNDIKKNSVN